VPPYGQPSKWSLRAGVINRLRGVLSNGLLNPDYNRDIQTHCGRLSWAQTDLIADFSRFH
jgi:hypothetical protein